MKGTLLKLRSQTDETKTRIALVAAVLVTAGIIALWITVLPKTLVANQMPDEVKAPSPFRALIDSISHATKSIPKPNESSQNTEPSVDTSQDVSEDNSYDESNPAPADTYAGEQVFTEE